MFVCSVDFALESAHPRLGLGLTLTPAESLQSACCGTRAVQAAARSQVASLSQVQVQVQVQEAGPRVPCADGRVTQSARISVHGGVGTGDQRRCAFGQLTGKWKLACIVRKHRTSARRACMHRTRRLSLSLGLRLASSLAQRLGIPRSEFAAPKCVAPCHVQYGIARPQRPACILRLDTDTARDCALQPMELELESRAADDVTAGVYE